MYTAYYGFREKPFALSSDEAREMLLATREDAYLAGAEAILRSDVRPLVSEIRASTLLIFGEEDPVLRHTPPWDLLDLIPDAEAVSVSGAAHRVFLEQPGPISGLVDDFLADPDGR